MIAILNSSDCFPLLSISGDSPDNLAIEVVQSFPGAVYIAISHVWADGLGNPMQTVLHRCQLLQVKNLVLSLHLKLTKALGGSSEVEANPVPLIWLDTLCCPITPLPAKIKAIGKLKIVYAEATHVLVLDSGLQQIYVKGWDMFHVPKANSTYPIELLFYIFTSGWMRRLWTLQEGALAKSLYFQFRDTAIRLEELTFTLSGFTKDSFHIEGFLVDVWSEVSSLQAFFRLSADLTTFFHQVNLEKALMYRSVSVRSDEPLCIGALLSLDVAQIANISPNDETIKQIERMKKVWLLMAEHHGGLPASILFFPCPRRMDSFGLNWAPATFLHMDGARGDSASSIRWDNSQIAKYDPQRGLSVQFPGFLLSSPKQSTSPQSGVMPWWDSLSFHAEWAPLYIREPSRGTWLRIHHNGYTSAESEKAESEAAYHLAKIRRLILQGDCAVIAMNSPAEHDSLSASTSFFTLAAFVRILSVPPGRESTATTLRVQFENYVTLEFTTVAETRVYSAIDRLAAALKSKSVALDLASARNPKEPGHKRAFQAVMDEMKAMMEAEYRKDSSLKPAVVECMGEKRVENLYRLIGEWYHCHQDMYARQLPHNQTWHVN
jgi:hypothetical protein